LFKISILFGLGFQFRFKQAVIYFFALFFAFIAWLICFDVMTWFNSFDLAWFCLLDFIHCFIFFFISGAFLLSVHFQPNTF